MARNKKRKSKFKGAVSRNSEKQNRGSQYGHLKLPKGMSVFKEEPKTRVMFDIMPYMVTSDYHPDRDDEYGIAVKGELWYKRPYWLHRDVGSDNQSVVCPTSMGQKCPICEYRAQLLKEGAKWDDDSVKGLKPSMRNLYVVIPKENKKFPEEPHIWDVSQFLFQEKLNEEVQENEDYETFPDLEEGFTLRVRFSEGTFGSNKFAEASRIDFIERDKAYNESILNEVPSLDELLEVPSYQALEAMFFGNISRDEADEKGGQDGTRDEEEEEEEKPRHRRRKSTNEDDEEEKPRRRRPPARSCKDEEDPDDPDDDESKEDDYPDEEDDYPDEEEEKSTKRKPSGKARQEKDKCPHGHKFGWGNDEHDECDGCPVWEECLDALE